MRNTLAQLLIVFVIALAIKLAYVHERVALPDVDHPVLDSKFHDEWAKGIAFNQWTADLARMKQEPYFRAPLYPYFVSAVYRTAGTSPRVLFGIQAILGALTVVLMFSFCALVFDQITALIAIFIQITYWPFTYHEAERLIPALTLPLDMLLLCMLVLAGRTGHRRYGALAGLAAGLSAIARPSILAVIPAALWWLLRRRGRAGVRLGAIMLAMATLAISPVTIRNAVRGGDLVFIASQGGVNFFIGNNPKSDGVHAVVPGARADWWGGYDDTRRMAEANAGRSLKPSEVSAYWYRRGIEFLLHQPGAALRLYARKCGLLLGNSEPSNERQLYFRRKHSRILPWLIMNFAFVLAMAVQGVRNARSRLHLEARQDAMLPVLLAISYAVGVVLFFVTSRFRLPVALFLVPIAALGCRTLLEDFSSRRWRRGVADAILPLVVFLASLANPLGIGVRADARGNYSLGVDHFRQGNFGEAIAAFDRSLREDSGYAPAWAMRGRAHYRLADLDVAISDLRRACSLDSTFSDAYYWLGIAYQRAGRHSMAEAPYLRCVEIDPTRVEAWTNLADVALRQGRKDDALHFLQRALSVDSTNVNAIYGMGYYLELSGEYDRAAAAYRRAIELPAARMGLERLERR